MLDQSSRVIMLHPPGHALPVLSVPSVHVTAVGTRPIAMPDLVLTSGTSIERREAAHIQTRLTFHTLTIRPIASGAALRSSRRATPRHADAMAGENP